MNISVLGSTGSIGTQTLDIVRNNPDINVLGISAYSDVLKAEAQVREFHPRLVCMADERAANELAVKISDTDTIVVSGESGLTEVACIPDTDTVVGAVVGIAGLVPTINAIKCKKKIALANKETLVCGGEIVTAAARQADIPILPVDSEHSAIFQSLEGCRSRDEVKEIVLTASGGPFAGKKRSELKSVTPGNALKHPNWSMGAKVTIDSSTMVNKGLEVIEAHWLFDVPYDKIRVVIHRQSIIHSMVMFRDNAIIAQLGTPDMRLPIQYALTYPERRNMSGNEFDFAKYCSMTFEHPDTEAFPALKLAYRAGRAGGNMPCIFNSSDEAAVDLFLKNKISYLSIADIIEEAMDSIEYVENPSVSDILETDKAARELVYGKYGLNYKGDGIF